MAQGSGAKAIFAENTNNSKSIEAISRAAGVKAVTYDDALYGDFTHGWQENPVEDGGGFWHNGGTYGYSSMPAGSRMLARRSCS